MALERQIGFGIRVVLWLAAASLLLGFAGGWI